MEHTEKATCLTVGFGLEVPVHRAPVKLTVWDEHNRFSYQPAAREWNYREREKDIEIVRKKECIYFQLKA